MDAFFEKGAAIWNFLSRKTFFLLKTISLKQVGYLNGKLWFRRIHSSIGDLLCESSFFLEKCVMWRISSFFPKIAGSYRGSYFSMAGFLIAEVRCRCRLVTQASPFMIWLLAAAALSPKLVSLHDFALGCRCRLVSQACLPSWFRSWLPLLPCLPSLSPFMKLLSTRPHVALMRAIVVLPLLLVAWHLPWLWHPLQAELPHRHLPGGAGWVELGSQIPSTLQLFELKSVKTYCQAGVRSEGRPSTWAWPELSMLLRNSPGEGQVKKRALKRALRSAERDGGTWYRNQWLVSPLRNDISEEREWHPMQKIRISKKPRSKVMSWNVGALTTELWEEIQHYAKVHQFDLMALQSTGWNFSSTWQIPGYSIIHSGSTDRYPDGLLLMVSHKLAMVERIRLKMQNNSMDYVMVYQHPWRNHLTPEENSALRQQVWDELHESLSKLPFRNQVILGGDFNAFTLNNNHPDHKILRQILPHHGMTGMTSFFDIFFAPGKHSDRLHLLQEQPNRCSGQAGFVDMHSPLGSWRDQQDHKPLVAPFLDNGCPADVNPLRCIRMSRWEMSY